MIVKTVIVDDNALDLTKLSEKFNAIDYPIYQCYCYSSPLDERIFENYADLYFFDIDMPEITGFELAKKINNLSSNAIVVFCSQHENLVFESFRLNFQYFIRKNYLDEDFSYAIEKLNAIFTNNNRQYYYEYKSVKRLLSNDEIMLFEVNHNTVSIYLETSEILQQRKSINTIEKELNSDLFIRIHNSYIINLKFIDSIKLGLVYLKNGKSYNISRNRYQEVLQSYRIYRIER